MRKTFAAVALTLLLSAPALAQGATKREAPRTLAGELNHQLKSVESEFVPLADAMPEAKYAFAPTQGEFKGVRNFESQVKHVAAANYLLFSAVLGEKPPVDTGGENGPASIKTKAQIMQFLKDSFAYAHKAIASINEKNAVEPIKSPFGSGMTTRLGLTTLTIGHCMDHYGQMVEYARMNGIIPPASRR